MSEQLHPGLHPDPDSLNAFIEGVLPEHERLQCLAHMSECARCREVVFLAQDPPAIPATSEPVSAWRRWLAPLPVLAAAAALSIGVVSVWLFMHRGAGTSTSNVVAHVTGTPPPVQPPHSAPDAAPEVRALTVANPRPEFAPKKIRPFDPGTLSASTHDTAPLNLPAPPPTSTRPAIPSEPMPFPPTLRFTLAVPSRPPSVDAGYQRVAAGISGTVIDASGAVVPGASIQVHQLDGTSTADARTDAIGQFNVAGLSPGRYDLQITAPGFRRTSKQIDLRPLEVATVKSQLEVGSVSETVEVTAASPMMQTSNASVSVVRASKKAPKGPRPLPSKLSAVDTVTSGKVMLAVDSAGTVFVSRNSGTSWKAVKPVWPGKVTLINFADSSQTTIAVFQLTTDSNSIWLSRDGARWRPVPPQH